MTTESARHRLEGNDFYKRTTPELAPIIRKGRLEKAMACYHRALNSAYQVDDRVTALKNLGTASWKTGCVLVQMEERIQTVNFYFCEGINYFTSALEATKRGEKPDDWRDHIKNCQLQAIQDFFSFCGSLDYTKRPGALEAFAKKVPVQNQAEVYMELADTLFKWAVTKQQDGDFQGCLNSLYECYFPIEECKRLGKDEAFLDDIEVMERDVEIQKSVAKSQQARKTGDVLFEKILNDFENINFEMVWEVVDWYTSAIILTREHDLENEAIAVSNLGKVYDKVLKMEIRAKENFKRVLQLAQSMHPRVFTMDSWYQTATLTLERYQLEKVQKEEKEWQNTRAKYVEELKHELAELSAKCPHKDGFYTSKERCVEALALMDFVYERFPPKKDTYTKPVPTDKEDFGSVKKALQKAVTHYHPDRQARYGMKWKVLCEEICKELTKLYEHFKG